MSLKYEPIVQESSPEEAYAFLKVRTTHLQGYLVHKPFLLFFITRKPRVE